MNFTDAIKSMQQGRRARRQKWETGSFAFFVPAVEAVVNVPPMLGILPAGAKIRYEPHFEVFTKSHVVKYWTPTAEDISAEDWTCVV